MTPKQTILLTLGRYLAAVLIIALAGARRAVFKYTLILQALKSRRSDVLKEETTI